jgi:hypothetical protein
VAATRRRAIFTMTLVTVLFTVLGMGGSIGKLLERCEKRSIMLFCDAT